MSTLLATLFILGIVMFAGLINSAWSAPQTQTRFCSYYTWFADDKTTLQTYFLPFTLRFVNGVVNKMSTAL